MIAKIEDLKGLPNWPLMLSAEQAAAYVGLSRPSFVKAAEDGYFPEPVSIGRRKLWHRPSLDKACEQLAGFHDGSGGSIPQWEWDAWEQKL